MIQFQKERISFLGLYVILLVFGACLPGVEVGGANTIGSVNSFLVNSGFVSFPHSTTLTLS